MSSARKGIDWAAEPLGVERDAVIAERLGVTQQAVYYARKARNINSPNRPIRPPCDPSIFIDELGAEHDRIIAERHGLHWQQVARARRLLGIPGARLNWDLMAPELGSKPDIVIARKYGVDNKTVAQARWRRGIPRWQETRRCPCGEEFVAFHLRQRYCSYGCQRYHWQLVNDDGMDSEAADCALALRAYRKTMKRKGLAHVEQLSGSSGHNSQRARAAQEQGDGRDDGTRRGSPSKCRNASAGRKP